MNKKSKLLANNLQKLFNSKSIQKIALKHQFVKRESKLMGEMFFNLCTFYGDKLCSSSLTNLCTKLSAKEGILISPQGLDNRFNKNSNHKMYFTSLHTFYGSTPGVLIC